MKIRDGTAGIAELITHFFFCISATAASLILRNSKLQKNLLHQTPRKFLLADLPCTHFAQSGFGDSPRAHTEIALLHRHRHSLLFSLPKRKILSNFHSVFSFLRLSSARRRFSDTRQKNPTPSSGDRTRTRHFTRPLPNLAELRSPRSRVPERTIPHRRGVSQAPPEVTRSAHTLHTLRILLIFGTHHYGVLWSYSTSVW